MNNRNTFRGFAAVVLAGLLAMGASARTRWTELKKWEFRKTADTEWRSVCVPHSCNNIDGQSANYYRGMAHYRTSLKSHGDKEQFLYVMGAAQRSVVSVDGRVVMEHGGGYTPYCVRLTPYLKKDGQSTVQIDCDNTLNPSLAPVSSDFNKNNGLHNKIYFVETNDVYCDFAEMGYDALHVTPLNVSDRKADIVVNTLVRNTSDRSRKVDVLFRIKDMKGRVVARSSQTVDVASQQAADARWTYNMTDPHLWNGLADPYLYTAEVELREAGKQLETNSAEFGVRYYAMDAKRGFILNGKPYSLRGFSIHQDWKGSASAVTDRQTDIDFKIIKELGCNVVRLAHYPHNRDILRHCDRLGLVVQTEIPWVNEIGADTTRYDRKAYTENLDRQLVEMINNHYNHPSVFFWGLWNELGNIGSNSPQGGKLDRKAAVDICGRLYRHAHRLDSTRSVGFADAAFGLSAPDLKLGTHFDYYGFNTYNGWYQNTKSPEGAQKFADMLRRLHQRAPYVGITEYGAGSNPFCHSDNPQKTTKPSVAGARHDEEWANIVHERHLQILSENSWLQFSTGWILFDFAVGARHEGFLLSSDGVTTTPDSAYMYLNDKGIVSRDRKMKKDAFYMYKAKWNKAEPTLHITSSRYTERATDTVVVKVYSNMRELTLYQNGREVERLITSGESSGVVWTFRPVLFERRTDVFKVVGRDNFGRTVSDKVTLRRKTMVKD